ncbi:MAG: hypothetical protein HRT61_00680 [Ekhidna sp.]|nr:hypothetical protein [Ekhidna sp.]
MSTEQTATPVVLDSGMDFLDQQPSSQGNDRDNSGALYPNTQRTKDNHPNVRGRCLVNNIWMWVSGWNNIQASSNQRYISLSFQPMTPEQIAKYVTNRPVGNEAPVQNSQAPVVKTAAQTAVETITTDENVEATRDEIF